MAGTEIESEPVRTTARRAAAVTLVVLAIVVLALALWKLKVVVALLLCAITIAAAMRPGVEWLARKHIPRPLGVLLHYLLLLCVVALVLWLVIPRLTTEVQAALDSVHSKHHEGGVKGQALDAIHRRLRHFPPARDLVHPALTVGEEAFKVLIGILFTFATAAYWIFERDRAVDLVASLLPRAKRRKLRDTWTLIDQKLGAFVRGQLILISFVCTTMSLLLMLVGEPYWLLVGIAVGFLEIIPIVGPMAAFVLVVGAGLTESVHTAVLAGAAMLGLRLFQDYVVNPHVMGGAVGLPPLFTMVSVSIVGILLGSFYVLLSIPLACLVVTVIDVTVRGVEPADVDVPKVLASVDRDA